MARWRYAGPGPQDDGQGGVVRPGEVREFPGDPNWGPFEPADDGMPPDGPESVPAAPGVQSPVPGADSQGAASPAAPAAGSAGAPDTGKGI